MRLRFVRLGVLLLLAAASTRADEAYYLIVFGSESSPKQLRLTHTWVTYVRVVGQGCDPSGWRVANVHTISWLPAKLDVRVFAPHPEPGVNLEVDQTLRLVLSQGQSVDVWAPMRIGSQVYAESVAHWHRLQRGEGLYQAIDPRNRYVHD